MIGKAPSGWNTKKFQELLEIVGAKVTPKFTKKTTLAFYDPVAVGSAKAKKAQDGNLPMETYEDVIAKLTPPTLKPEETTVFDALEYYRRGM